MAGKAYIGTSGWNYKSWRNGFYGDTPQKRWLRFCAERFSAIEVNGTFYRLQEKSTFKKWRDETPKHFVFAIKGHRYVTHNKKLLDVGEVVIHCRESASPLGKRLVAVGPGSRLAGLSAIHARLALRDNGRSAGLKIFRGCCPNLVRRLPALVYSARSPEEIDPSCENHAVDALRYGLLWKKPEGRRVRLGGI